MTTDERAQETGRPTRRPPVVTAAVAIWAVVLVVRVVTVAIGAVHLALSEPGALPAALFGGVLGLGICALLAWATLLVWRGSGTARVWLGVMGAFAVVNVVVVTLTGNASWLTLEAVAVIAAAVLLWLPSARPWFPRTERRPRVQEPRTIGWDPQTGERITEPHEVADPR
ncbi:hypothetical protein C1N91_13630 [Curtobacterium sp. SGAir0471]|uniref:hypothetical protein n=1 Tax=Curtobacterium sp. SGAir0471 TaxID=2070337 RepID=UPI0010CCC664|nr:hypothetical protein [Curtobacterium sp. SGAir0471]QCR44402.1 hypothetical protein C1N91_13630 [Curtobacterium sp. SGAir0471]